MTLIKSISGIRGTIGGKVGDNLSPVDIVKFTAAYATFLKQNDKGKTIVVGRDARISGEMVRQLVVGTLIGMGYNVVDLGLSTTPTVEMAVVWEQAAGGIILTASHNPKQWNALKLLNEKGEFISGDDGQQLIEIAESESFTFAEVDNLGNYSSKNDAIQKHIEAILALPTVDVEAIKAKKFKIAVDAVNSIGGISIPPLLEQLGCETVKLYCEPTGHFPHNPEPLPQHLTDLSEAVVNQNCHLGITCDPDVDRLAFVNEDGTMFGEEYTIVAIADYLLGVEKGDTVSNMSSSIALKKITEKHNGNYHFANVGEVNVVAKMKEVKAVFGGEGNGGVIYPALHYGRDALVGIALFLSHLAKTGLSCSALRATYPNFEMVKDKIQLTAETDIDGILEKMKQTFVDKPKLDTDGLKVFFNENEWVHLRKSNTEPIIRVYAESTSAANAQNLVNQVKALV